MECHELVQIYRADDGTDVVALRNVDLSLDAGGRLALLGPSGSGKSTLLHLLAGLVRPTAGAVQVGPFDLGGLSPRELRGFRARTVGTLLQGASRNLFPYATAVQNVTFPRRALSRRERRALPDPEELLHTVAASHLVTRNVGVLSGGEQQRVAVAVAMANAPGMLLADEPTSQLGPEHRAEVVDALCAVNATYGTTLVTVTHDQAVAARLGHTVTIRDGRVGTLGRHRDEFVVVARDGGVQLPPSVLRRWPPGTLLSADDDGTELRLREAEQ